jgi:fumarylacetoacetate (FAA) hydrolase
VKLATLRNGQPDGCLVVVSRDLCRYVLADAIAANLREAIERWDETAPALTALAAALEGGRAAHVRRFNPADAAAPLPRAFGWLDGSAFLNHIALMTRAFGAAPGPDAASIPLVYQGASDDFLAPYDRVPLPREEDGIDFEAEFGIVLGPVAMGSDAAAAAAQIRLVVLINDWSLRALGPREMATGFGFVGAKPATAFAPVAVTPDELGPAWRDGRVQCPVQVDWNGTRFGTPQGGEMHFSFGEIAAHAARTRNLGPGTILGSGTVSNSAYAEVGSACIAERRAIDMIEHGEIRTPFMRFGDRVRIEVLDEAGATIFGAIDQEVVQAGAG